ncbi:creatinine amidohydrolase [Opitutus sp. GAS368]|nr:creatininase family protein [Opitutus sp. GAS368]SDS18441.1 creatinine amidohydrolase [Opitutus sp. GAS368]
MCSGRCDARKQTGVACVHWAELLPDEFRARRAAAPLAWLPLGLCEPHGHIAAYGLDTIKAEWLCTEAARRFGGIVVPTQAWHIHETGYHARWLEDVIGQEEGELGTLPPDVLLRTFLYQLRALANAGFRAVVAVSGHAGGNQQDLRRVAAAFSARVPVAVDVFADPELVAGTFAGDHAGKFEISQLMAIRPDLVDLSRLRRGDEPGAGGSLAIGNDAAESTLEHGRAILEAQVAFLGKVAKSRLTTALVAPPAERVTFAVTEEIWTGIMRDPKPFVTAHPLPDQAPVASASRWKSGEHFVVTGQPAKA